MNTCIDRFAHVVILIGIQNRLHIRIQIDTVFPDLFFIGEQDAVQPECCLDIPRITLKAVFLLQIILRNADDPVIPAVFLQPLSVDKGCPCNEDSGSRGYTQRCFLFCHFDSLYYYQPSRYICDSL